MFSFQIPKPFQINSSILHIVGFLIAPKVFVQLHTRQILLNQVKIK